MSTLDTSESQALWQQFCELYKHYPETGVQVDISRVRLPEEYLDNMQPIAENASNSMQKLEAGGIANPDENRMVGHYWLRAPELAPEPEIQSQIKTELEKIKSFAKAVHSGEIKSEKNTKFRKLILVGIGGSALGPQLVYDALWRKNAPIEPYFCDNTDPDGIQRTLAHIGNELSSCLVLVVSKSGGTPETRNGALEMARAFQQHGLSFARHAVAITCEGSKLDLQAKENKWLGQFYLWDWVGGRTSIFSAVGLLPAALQGIDIDSFISGAKEMDNTTRHPDVRNNPALLLALSWYSECRGKGEKDMVILPYKDRLCLMSKYLQQLVMESLGKAVNLDGEVVNQGIAVYGNKGSTDQHAYVQQLRDGVNNFFVTFIEVLDDFSLEGEYRYHCEVEDGVTSGDYLSGFLQGTRRALYENGRNSITITLDRLNEHTLGALIALYDRAVGFYASLVNINAYNQPGVEAGKKAAAEVIKLQKQVVSVLSRTESYSAEEIAAKAGRNEQTESVYRILEHLASNTQTGIIREGERHPLKSTYRKA